MKKITYVCDICREETAEKCIFHVEINKGDYYTFFDICYKCKKSLDVIIKNGRKEIDE
jgi:hypothetical protein